MNIPIMLLKKIDFQMYNFYNFKFLLCTNLGLKPYNENFNIYIKALFLIPFFYNNKNMDLKFSHERIQLSLILVFYSNLGLELTKTNKAYIFVKERYEK